MAENTKKRVSLTSPGYLMPFFAVTVLYFIFGFVTNLNMGLVPELKKIF
jgi:FHS family L-fucose permease-like MFS transporter